MHCKTWPSRLRPWLSALTAATLAFGIGMWAAATSWLIAHAVFHLWEVAVGICSPSVISRDFPAVTLPAIIGTVLTLWAINHARVEQAASA